MAVHLNGSPLPAWVFEKGRSTPKRKTIVGQDGEGKDIEAGYASYTFNWPYLKYAEYAWWEETLLGGAPFLVLTSAELYDHKPVLRAYTAGIVHAPTYSGFEGNEVIDVTVVIDQLI